MPTMRSFIRSVGAAARRAEREQKRYARETARRYKEQQKQQEIEDASEAVEVYNRYVETLQSMHKECSETIDWIAIENEPAPVPPQKQAHNQFRIQQKIDEFKPSIMDKVLGRTESKISLLKQDLNDAKREDNLIYQKEKIEYHKQVEDWKKLQNISSGVLQQDARSFMSAIEYFDPYSEIDALGSRLEIGWKETSTTINLYNEDDKLIPDYELRQTSTGKLSKKNMSKSNYYLLYQDYICSCVLRIARETFAYLPIPHVRINVLAKILNSKTGYMDNMPILSVNIVEETLASLNIEKVDPSDCMQNFIHNMDFLKTKGFRPVKLVTPV